VKKSESLQRNYRFYSFNTGHSALSAIQKSKAGKAYPTHIIREGETMYQIAQTYAIKTEKLYLLNQMPFSEGAKTGRVLKLR